MAEVHLSNSKIATYRDFWPHYLREHGKPRTRGHPFLRDGAGHSLASGADPHRRPVVRAGGAGGRVYACLDWAFLHRKELASDLYIPLLVVCFRLPNGRIMDKRAARRGTGPVRVPVANPKLTALVKYVVYRRLWEGPTAHRRCVISLHNISAPILSVAGKRAL